MRLLLHGARAVDADGVRADAWLLFDGDRIAATGQGPELPAAQERIDLRGGTIVPGFIDLHGHGAGGASYDEGPEGIRRALAVHRAHGTTRSVLSLVAAPLERLELSLAQVAQAAASDPLVLGSHLEGPFLAPERRGAHDAGALIEPTPERIAALYEAAAGTLRQITIAPELPHALDAIEAFAEAGVRVAVGHTAADRWIAAEAFRRGATLLTHAFNAMPGLHHRDPGPVGAAIDDDRVRLELILDGRHVDATMARLLFRAAPGRVALVTDSMAATGAADGVYALGSREVHVHEGSATLAGTSTLAGSVLAQDEALRIALAIGVDEVAAVAALTAVPAAALGLGARFGRLAPGFAADAVQLDERRRVRAVWAAGRRVV
ncbi:N-acetylglucosamine-6-phosphate deacetylase [Arenivirga flava]|uniref:N-acetylglucosamine-6-phosphate deacetylase n=1 Tax=Arenivirga flava TaxID=1930060 RepID=A0AA37UNE2_9MICO|nr:N-acetylglucosamine-6-phosphate deacetylase [Arenivirga flava]GMA28131.1 N-acetylglucosamine-6-phosphate deacetylase [Arenivirga flava]